MTKSTVICREDVGLVPPTRLAVSWLTVRVLGLTVLAITPVPVSAQVGSASLSEQGTTHMDELELANPELLQLLFRAPEKPEEEASPFFRDTKISAQARTYYFNRDKFNPARSEAWAIGGSAAYKSGYAADRFAIGGVAISLLAGVIFARAARMPRGPSARRGALVGGLCALIGIAVSLGLGDVPPIILLIGTASSAVGGAIGGAVAAT